MAIVSLQKQQITVYDANGWILRAPVSSGQTGRETPAGIFSVIQKDADHHSNLYDDALMPHMQRVTWSGIALHGGPLPGYPASHGCIRMPFDFAERLFEMTRLGMRVIVAPTDVVPIEIAHPVLALLNPRVGALATTRTAEAEGASKKAEQTRFAAGKAFREAAQARTPVRAAENLKARAELQLTASEAALSSASSVEEKEQAEQANAQAVATIEKLQAQLATARAELQPKLDAVASTREAAILAEAAEVAAVEAARQLARKFEPVSVLISRKTQRLYMRQGFEPILESPVSILDADRPIGTNVFTVIEPNGDGSLRWSVVSVDDNHPRDLVGRRERAQGRKGRGVETMPTDPDNAKSALDRIVIAQDTLDRIAMAPRSSLIITDEALSSETGKGTDFVVILSGQPQGGIKIRRRDPDNGFGYSNLRVGPFDRRLPSVGPLSSW